MCNSVIDWIWFTDFINVFIMIIIIILLIYHIVDNVCCDCWTLWRYCVDGVLSLVGSVVSCCCCCWWWIGGRSFLIWWVDVDPPPPFEMAILRFALFCVGDCDCGERFCTILLRQSRLLGWLWLTWPSVRTAVETTSPLRSWPHSVTVIVNVYYYYYHRHSDDTSTRRAGSIPWWSRLDDEMIAKRRFERIMTKNTPIRLAGKLQYFFSMVSIVREE